METPHLRLSGLHSSRSAHKVSRLSQTAPCASRAHPKAGRTPPLHDVKSGHHADWRRQCFPPAASSGTHVRDLHLSPPSTAGVLIFYFRATLVLLCMLSISALETGLTVGEVAGLISGSISLRKAEPSYSLVSGSNNTSSHCHTTRVGFRSCRHHTWSSIRRCNLVVHQPFAPKQLVAHLAPVGWCCRQLPRQEREMAGLSALAMRDVRNTPAGSGQFFDAETACRDHKSFQRPAKCRIRLCSR